MIPDDKKSTRSAAMRRNQVFNDSTKYRCDRIRNERWQWRKNDAVILVALVASSLMSIGQVKLNLLSGNWISMFSNSDLDLDHIHLGSNSKLRLDVSYPYTKFGVNRPKELKLLSRNWIPVLETVTLTLITDT